MSKFRSNKLLFAHHVKKFLSEFPDLQYDGSQMICVVCDKQLLCWNRTLCRRHINSESHKYKKSGRSPYTEFLFDLIFMLSACNMPFNLMEKQPFRQFWKGYNPTWKLPSRTTLRKNLPYVRDKIENHIKSKIQNEKLWLTVDKIVDSKKHFVINIIVRTLNPFAPSPPYLIASKRLVKCTGEAIQQLVLVSLERLQVPIDQVVMLVSDDTPSMLLAGRILENICPNLIHVICILHALHHVGETIRNCYPDIDALIVLTKAVFVKSPKHSREFHRQCSSIGEPPQPVHTRGVTWLQAAFYYFKHFQKIKSLILQFDSEESIAVRESQLKFQNGQVEADLETIYNNYVVVVDAAGKFENNSLSLVESLEILDSVAAVLYALNDEGGIHAKETFDCVLRKNPGLNRLRQIYNNSALTDPCSNLRAYFKYANITSIDAEQSFSLYQNIFSPLRTCLTETTTETYAMLQMFSRAHPDF